jgi:outer membrane lipase/esterase
MRFDKGLASGLLAAILLVACGGGSGDGSQAPKYKFTSMVNFGDSLSDVGTYAVGAVAAAGGGKFTVNGPAAKNWTEILAAQLGVAAPCAAQTGLTGTYNVNPAYNFDVTPVDHTECRNYAQGGSRVTHPFGPSNYYLASATSAPPYIGALTVPVTTQIDKHLSVVTNFTGTELVTVMAGANDLFIQLSIFSVLQTVVDPGTAANFRTYAMTFAGWTDGEVTTVLTNGSPAAAAGAMVVNKMGAVGADLASMIVTRIKGNGAKYTLVLNMPNVSKTPYIIGLSSDAMTGTVSAMTLAFNAALKAGLAGQSNIWLGDAYTTNSDQLEHPEQYGITNKTTPACDSNLVASSLFCSSYTTVAPDVSTYLFADSVHPTPYGYKLFAQEAAKHLVLAGWL